MTEQEKKLLVADLCARLPYGVVCGTSVGNFRLLGIDENVAHLDSPVYDKGDGYFDINYEEDKPYLRRMSSMTEDERTEYLMCCNADSQDMLNHPNYRGLDWLNVHYFDYRGLIEMGLALETPEGMYN